MMVSFIPKASLGSETLWNHTSSLSPHYSELNGLDGVLGHQVRPRPAQVGRQPRQGARSQGHDSIKQKIGLNFSNAELIRTHENCELIHSGSNGLRFCEYELIHAVCESIHSLL